MTNIIKSFIGVVKSKVGPVKYWDFYPNAKNSKTANTAVRWAASASQEYRKKMCKLKVRMKQIARLKENLNPFDNLLSSA